MEVGEEIAGEAEERETELAPPSAVVRALLPVFKALVLAQMPLRHPLFATPKVTETQQYQAGLISAKTVILPLGGCFR
jgi:hypothetical protein